MTGPKQPSQSVEQKSETGSAPRHSDAETVTLVTGEHSTQNLRRPPVTGRRFGEYELLDEIARGGMGVVYRARQVGLNRIVALKMILAGRLAGEEAVRRFRTEAEAAAKLEHPNIVPIFDIGQVEDQQFFSMGFVEGPSLAERLREGPLPSRAAAEMTRLIALAVHYAHEQGVIHRDLKPGNVLLKEATASSESERELNAPQAKLSSLNRTDSRSAARGLDAQPMLTDFGLAKLQQVDSELTSSGQILGTPAYMPPEQAAGRMSEVGPLSDVYSLGAVLYCALTGRPPFQAAGPVETLQQVLHYDPVPPRQLNPDVDRDLETICLKCLEKQPADRYASAFDLADELDRLLRGEPISARPASAGERARKWVRRRPAIAALLGVSSLAVVSLAALSVGSYYHVQLQQQKKEVEAQRSAAEQARDEIAQQKREVERQKSLVEIERDRTRRIQYASDLNMADRAWQESQVGRMFGILDRNVPQDGEPDLRGFEWYYLWLQGNWHESYFRGTYGARSMALARDAQLAATSGWGEVIDLWDLATGQKRDTITAEDLHDQTSGDSDVVLSVALTQDAGILVIGMHSGRLIAWDCDAREVIFESRTGTGERGYVNTVDVTGDGRLIAAGDSDGGLKLWNRSGELVREFKGHSTDSIAHVRFSPDEMQLASACSDHSVSLWNVDTGENTSTLTGHTNFATCLDWSPDGQSIAGGAYNEQIRIWDAVTGDVKHVLSGHRGSVNDVTYSPDGNTLASCAADGAILLWDASNGSRLRTIRGHTDYIFSVDWSADGSRILSSSSDGSTRIWNLASFPESAVLDSQTPMTPAVVFSQDGSKFATVCRNGPILIRESISGNVSQAIGGGLGYVTGIDFHPDGRQIAAGSADGVVRLWNLTDGSTRQLTTHDAGVPDVAFSPDGEQLVTGSDDKTARVIDVETGETLHILDQHTNFVWAVAWSPDGQWIATGGHDGSLMLWEADTGRMVRSWAIFNFPAGMTFSPDSALIATPAQANGVDLHSVETGEIVQTFRGHTDGIGGIAFSPDQRRVFTSSWDRTVKIWDAESAMQTLTLPSTDKINRIAVSPAGDVIVGIGDHTVTMWFAPLPSPSLSDEPDPRQ